MWFVTGWAGRLRARSPATLLPMRFSRILAPAGGTEPMKPQARLNAAIQAANQAVYQQSRQSATVFGHGHYAGGSAACADSEWKANGSHGKRRTATDHTNSRVTDPPTLWLGHVGDSRCYRLRRGALGAAYA